MKSGIAKRISIEIRMCVGSNGAGLTGMGLGSFMMKTALEQAKENGFEQVELGVYSDNLRARHMYTKMEFTEYGMNPRAFKLKDGTYVDEIIMVNFLEHEV